jgi:primosomal protein N' (replication factor Y) (superfamily II helicase)
MSAKFATVIVPNIPRGLTYSISAGMEEGVHVGSIVKIPVGRTWEVGPVVALQDKAPQGPWQIKAISEVVYPFAVLTPELIRLAEWISSYYACPLCTVYDTLLPSVVRQPPAQLIQREFVLPPPPPIAGRLGPQQQILLEKMRTLPTGASANSSMLNTWGISPSIAQALVKKGLLRLIERAHYRSAYNDSLADGEIVATLPPELMTEQAEAVALFGQLLAARAFNTQLLHGVTGSGKTEVYLRLISQALAQGQSALLLVPEVALTPQMIGRLRGRFGADPQQCVVWHSSLSAGERADAYRAIATGRCRIVVGARSALFAPLRELGLIIVDEEHEGAYKQEEAPRYHARQVAIERARHAGALCILGSATPSLESIYAVRQGEMGLQLMTKRIDDRPMPIMHVVDLKRSLGKTPWLSTLLKSKIADRLEKKEQIILFLNRRGHSTSFLCTKCGYVAQCHQCSIPLTYHIGIEKLRCHLCGYETKAPQSCPGCASTQVRWRGVGTQKVEGLLKSLYNTARIARVDSDALNEKNTLRHILGSFRRGELDILIGTQMIAKGLDFPNVTLVGLIDADLSLHQPDFRAAERTFQLLVQVAGRAGRGDRSGEVVVQTFLPHAPTLQYARHVDYNGFIEEELAQRQSAGYPPYRHLIQHLFRATSPEKLSFYCEAWAREVAKVLPQIEIRGPSPAPIEKIEGMYRYQLWYMTDEVAPIVAKLTELRSKFPFDDGITDTLDVDASQLF